MVIIPPFGVSDERPKSWIRLHLEDAQVHYLGIEFFKAISTQTRKKFKEQDFYCANGGVMS